jgi:hypothetical protein
MCLISAVGVVNVESFWPQPTPPQGDFSGVGEAFLTGLAGRQGNKLGPTILRVEQH